jgi:hypothetical protein
MPDLLGLCLDCNYPLRGLAQPRCPECGLEFDPQNPATMNMGAPLTRTAKWVLGPMRWPTIVGTVAAALVVLWATRLPRNWLDASRVGLAVLVMMGVVWLAWPIVRTITARKYHWPKERLTKGAPPRYIVGALLLIEAFAIARAAAQDGVLDEQASDGCTRGRRHRPAEVFAPGSMARRV